MRNYSPECAVVLCAKQMMILQLYFIVTLSTYNIFVNILKSIRKTYFTENIKITYVVKFGS